MINKKTDNAYEIVISKDVDNLAETVNLGIAEGYVPQGGVCESAAESSSPVAGYFLYQALYKPPKRKSFSFTYPDHYIKTFYIDSITGYTIDDTAGIIEVYGIVNSEGCSSVNIFDKNDRLRFLEAVEHDMPERKEEITNEANVNNALYHVVKCMNDKYEFVIIFKAKNKAYAYSQWNEFKESNDCDNLVLLSILPYTDSDPISDELIGRMRMIV